MDRRRSVRHWRARHDGYGVYEFGREFFGDSDVPVAMQIALPATVIGLVVLLVTVVKDRMKNRKDENLKEVKY